MDKDSRQQPPYTDPKSVPLPVRGIVKVQNERNPKKVIIQALVGMVATIIFLAVASKLFAK